MYQVNMIFFSWKMQTPALTSEILNRTQLSVDKSDFPEELSLPPCLDVATQVFSYWQGSSEGILAKSIYINVSIFCLFLFIWRRMWRRKGLKDVE